MELKKREDLKMLKEQMEEAFKVRAALLFVRQEVCHFYTRGRIIRLWERGKAFVIRLAMRLLYKDGHKTQYASGQIIFRCATSKTYNERYFVWKSMRIKLASYLYLKPLLLQ